jgi:acetyltransferase
MRKQLLKLFQPESIAVIGASDDKQSVGYAVMKNLLEGGFKGTITPVNIKRRKVFGRKAYYYLRDLPEIPDLAIITTPAYAVLQVVRECGEAGVVGLAILSAGFNELDEESKHRNERILQIAREYGMRVLGPNSLGFINPHAGLNASFSHRIAKPGNIAFISQSGALGIATLDWAVEQSVGFSYFVAVGNMSDIGFADLIDFLGADYRTTCILIYMESIRDPRRFMSAARAFARYKPIIVLKAGRSHEGLQLAFSHTGTLAGDDAAFSAAFNRSGIIRVSTISQLFNCAQSLAMQPSPTGKRLAILTNALGPSILATDYLVKHGGQLAQLSDKTFEKLNAALPVNWSHQNPVNVLGDAGGEIYADALTALVRDDHVDAVLVVLTYLSMSDPDEIAKAVTAVNKKSDKTILATWMGEAAVQNAREILEQGKVPNYRYPESAIDVFLKMYEYHRNLELLYETPSEEPVQFHPQKEKAAEIISKALAEGRSQLLENEAKALLHYYDLPITDHQLVQSADAAVAFAKSIGYPVALKLASPDIYRKSDIGGVQLNLSNATAVRKAYKTVKTSVEAHAPEAAFSGVVIEKMMNKAFELFIGMRKDPVLGPILVFGRGGIAVEVYQDMQLGLPPLNMALAKRLIEHTRIYPLLQGYRGQKGVELDELAFLLCKFAYLVMDFPEIKELDINPLAIDEQGSVVLDAHVVLDESITSNPQRGASHLIIPPYPGRYQKWITAKNGKKVLLRPIRPEDEPMELAMVNKLSRESLYFRFFGYVPKLDHQFMIRFTQIDYDREMAIIALVEEEGQEEMIGVVRIVADPWGEAAEYAIIIADHWQGQSLGSQMTDYIIEIARDMRLKRIYASALATNKGMLRLFDRKGFTLEQDDYDTYNANLLL